MTEPADPELLELYVHLYFDEDVPLGIARRLRRYGYDVISAHEVEMRGKPDNEQLLYAMAQQRAIVTHNREDFETEHRKLLEAGQKHYGVIIAKRRLLDAEVATRISTLLNAITAEEMEDQLRYI